ncbi:MAG TPA: DUF4082 domain-containing protein [Solirubrobacterales bacterium]
MAKLWALRLMPAVLAATALVAWPGGPASAADPCAAPVTNKVACENTKPGDPPSDWQIDGIGDASIQGFATQMSVNVGQTVDFKIKTPASSYHIDILRLGYYGGDGARKIASNIQPSASLPQSQPSCTSTSSTGLVECGNWKISASWTVPSTAVSGLYVAHLVRNDTGGESQILFVVRDDSSHSDLVLKTSDATWQAYNAYGGNSLYTCTVSCPPGDPGGYKAAYAVSYNRPFDGTLATDSGVSDPFYAEYQLIRFLERNGYDMSYVSDHDVEAGGSLLQNHKVFISSAHDEYWSAGERQNVEAARGAGVNLAFFSGNEVFWKTRWTNSSDGSNTPYRTLVTYKDTHFPNPVDPLGPGITTPTWRDPRFSPPGDAGRPENSLSGQLFLINSGTSEIKVPGTFAKLRFWRNTAVSTLSAGQTLTLAPGTGTLGYEWDVNPDNRFRPAGRFPLSSTTVSGVQAFIDYGTEVEDNATATHSLSLYRAPSGALVFGAGTVQWSWGLDVTNAWNDAGPDGEKPDPTMQQATVNLMADMGAQPATLQSPLIATSGSTDSTAPTAALTAPADGASVSDGNTTTISGTASDTGGGVVAAVEVSTDGGATWHTANGTTSWTYPWTVHGYPSTTIRARAIDDSGNIGAASAARTVSVSCPCSVFGSTVPETVDAGDTHAVEVGVKFRSDVAGNVTGIRFYKSSSNTGTHVGNLWTLGGTNLAKATFSGESSSGWQQVSFSSPVAIQPNTTYVASYFAPKGHYSAAEFAVEHPPAVGADNLDAPPLHILPDKGNGNGLYEYSTASTFPQSTFHAENYWVDVLFAPTGPSQPPGQVTNVSATAGMLQANVNWTPPSTGGAPSTYQITPYIGSTAQTPVTVTAPATSAVITGLSGGTTYTFKVKAVNALGAGPDSAASNPVTPTTPSPPEAPTGVSATAGPLQATVNWTAPSSDGGSPITSYRVTPYIGSAAQTPVSVAAPASSTTITGLSGGTTYTFKVAAINAVGPGQDSAASNSVTPTTPNPPGAPTGVSATAGPLQATVNWTAPSSDGGSPITSYRVTPYIGSAAQTPVSVAAPASSTTVTNLAAGTAYTFRVAAVNVAGPGSDSSASNPVTPTPAPSLAVDTTVTAHQTSGSSSISSPAFSTSASGELLLAFISSDGPSGGGGQSFSSVSGAGLTWRLRSRSNAQPGTAEIWQANAPATLSNATVTATRASGSYVGSITVVALIGADQVVDGTTATGSSSTGAPSVSLTTTRASSWIWGVGNDWDSATARTVGPNQTKVDEFLASVGDTMWVQRQTLTTPLSGTLVTLNDTAPTNDRWNLAAIEVLGTTQGAAPATPILSSTVPASPANQNSPKLVGSAPAGSSVSIYSTANCSGTPLAGGSAAELGAGITVPVPDDSSTALRATATAAGVSSACSAPLTYVEDSTAPQTQIGAHPAALSTSPAASFEFSGEDAGSGVGSLQCRLDSTEASAWAGCASPKSYASLADGAHLFEARAIDKAGNTDATPASFEWQIDATPPTAVIDAGPSGVTEDSTPTFEFHSSEAGSSFACSIDTGTASFGACSGPGASHTPASPLADGSYTFRVRATDAAGNQGTATRSFTVDSPANPPGAPSGLTAIAKSSGAQLSWTAAAGNGSPIVSYRITPYIGGAAQTPLSTGSAATSATIGGLTNGTTYTFTVAAINAGGPGPESTPSAAITPYATIFDLATPATVDAGDAKAVELGVKFRSDVAGTVNGIRFYKAAANTGTHVGSLWNAGGTLLAQESFSAETASGWQQVKFPSAVAIQPNTTYIAGYLAPKGHYSVNGPTLSAGVDNPPLHALANSASANGVYIYSSTAKFPTNSYQSSNYWVDVLFTPAVAAQPPGQVTGVSATAGPGRANVSWSAPASDGGSAITGYRVTPYIGSAAQAPVTVAAPATSKTITGLTAGTTYTFKVAAINAIGTGPDSTASNPVTPTAVGNGPDSPTGVTAGARNQGALVSWSAPANEGGSAITSYRVTPYVGNAAQAPTTVPASTTSTTIGGLANGTTYTFRVTAINSLGSSPESEPSNPAMPRATIFEQTVPTVIEDTDSNSVELGVKFTSDVAGTIRGIRFYKGPGNVGTHVVSFWNAAGELLEQDTATGESASGWQEVQFASPVPIAPGTVYVAGYLAPNGHYSVIQPGFTSAVDSPPLHALANATSPNGVYSYSPVSIFPTDTFNSSNYSVDVMFTP